MLSHRDRASTWAEHSLPQPLTPVRHIALNLGAPGDRRDAAGRLWIHCPNRVHKYHWLSAKVSAAPGAGYYCSEADAIEPPGGCAPWIFTSGFRGLQRLSVPLLEKGAGAAGYTVRLCFAEPDGLGRGRRVFDVSLQGRRVLRAFDVAEAAGGGPPAVVREFKGVRVTDSLVVELSPVAGAKVKLPVLCGLEAVREDH